MTSRDPIRTGQSGRLRVQFVDSAGLPIEATGVTVDLFAPGLDPDVDPATSSGLVPTHIGLGVFELVFTAGSPGGSWIDRWTGNILGSGTTALQYFTVLDSGAILSYPIHGLQENTLVEINLSSEIADLSGNQLEEDFTFRFSTTYTPLYSSVRKVKLEAGGIIGNLADDTINLAILEASLEADVINFRKTITNENIFQHARREYVTCSAAMGLSQNILANGGVIKSKMLADFKVDYDVNVLGDLLNNLNDCAKKWEAQVQTGGGARVVKNPKMVVKGDLDPDRPATGRQWYRMSPGEAPIGNNKYRVSGSRRWRTGWISRTGGSNSGSDW
jgi:hypothetical protein